MNTRHEMKAGPGKFFGSLNKTTVRSLIDLIQFDREHPKYAFLEDDPGQGYLEWALYQQSAKAEY